MIERITAHQARTARNRNLVTQHDSFNRDKFHIAGMLSAYGKTHEKMAQHERSNEVLTMPDNVDRWWLDEPYLSPETRKRLEERGS